MLVNHRATIVTIVSTLLAAFLLITSLVGFNQPGFVNILFLYITPLFTLTGAILAVWLWVTVSGEKTQNQIMVPLAGGFSLWTLAEVYWALMTIQGQEIPYPSAADYLWLAGYIPLYLALISRLRSLKVKLTWRQRILLISTAVISALLTFFLVFFPVLQEFDPQYLAESLLNLIYPLADLALFLLVMAVIFVHQAGRFSIPWKTIAIGFILISLADLWYAYAAWNEIYYPDNLVNPVSFVIDYAYALSYLAIALGFYLYLQVVTTKDPIVEKNISPETVPTISAQQYYLVCTDKSQKILTASENIQPLLNVGPDEIEALDFQRIFHVEEAIAKDMFERIDQNGFINNFPIEIINYAGKKTPVRVNATAAYNPGKEFSGANIAISMASDFNPNYSPPSEYKMSIIQKILEITGARDIEYFKMAKAYFTEYILSLYNLANQVSGFRIGNRFLDHFNGLTLKNGWAITMDPQHIFIADDYLAIDFRRASQEMILAMKAYTEQATSLDLVNQEVERLNHRMDEHTLVAASEFGFIRDKRTISRIIQEN
jgi:hypothetical protein